MTEISTIDPSKVTPSVFIGCVGYESRSIHALNVELAKKYPFDPFIFDYASFGRIAYDSNRAVLCANMVGTVSNFRLFLIKISDHILKLPVSATVLLDATSLDRRKLSLIIETLFSVKSNINSVKICYYPRTYISPRGELEQVTEFGPVSSRFIGQASLDRNSLSLIVGAGFEFGRVVGAIDVLEPEITHCFYPVGTDPRFESAISKNNLDFVFLDDPDLLLPYELLNPEDLYFSLRRLVEIEVSHRNVLILPLGPKIFAAISILVAIVCGPSVMVWRHSTVDTFEIGSISDAVASGKCAEFAFRFRTSPLDNSSFD